mgnify:CR=1 FL=1
MENIINLKISEILKEIINKYNSLNEFADKSGISSAYISKLINLKYKNPPSPRMLKKISEASKGVVTYNDLMQICNYYNEKTNNSLLNTLYYAPIPVFSNEIDIEEYEQLYYELEDKNKLLDCYEHIYFKISHNDDTFNYFAYKISDDDMLPLVGIGDVAIIEKTDKFVNGNTCLISIDTNTIFIRKIIDFKDYIELHTAIPYSQPIKLTNEEMKKRNFKILGKVIRVENSSAFK